MQDNKNGRGTGRFADRESGNYLSGIIEGSNSDNGPDTTINTPSHQKSLEDLFSHALKVIYYAEDSLHHKLPTMIDLAKDQELKAALTMHCVENATHIAILQQIARFFGMALMGKKSEAIEGLVSEGDEMLKVFASSEAGDAAIISSCQAIEHYEIAKYGSMHSWAVAMGVTQVARLLSSILEQKKAANSRLAELAEQRINRAAEFFPA